MAEGRRDRSGRRRRSAQQERGGGGQCNHQSHHNHRASSDSELAQAGGGGGGGPAESGKKKCFFHEGLDVDQLARYRRRRVAGQPRDHLGLRHAAQDRDPAASGEQQRPEEEEEDDEDEDDRRKRLVTEYRLAFRASSDDIFRASEEILSPIRTKRHVNDNSLEQRRVEEISVVNSRASYHVPLNSLKDDHGNTQDQNALTNKSQSEINLAKIMEMGTDVMKRPAPIRRPTTLRYEGDFSMATEYSNFVPYPGLHRSELQRRGTSLRMEGDFETSTEKSDKYVGWPATWHRPELARLQSNLRLEGELETSTESHDQYVPFVGARRPELLRQSAQLRLEGDANWTPEYTDVFRQFKPVERQQPMKPESNLKPGGGFYEKTESTEFFTNPRDKEAELMAELAKDAEEEEEKKKREEEERNRLKKEEEMRLLVSKLEDLKGPPLEIPEYKDAYKDFPRERPKLLKPEDEIGRADGSKVTNAASPSHTRFRTKIDQDPEYKSIYIDSSRERPVYHRPPPSLRPSVAGSTSRSSLLRAPVTDLGRRDSRLTPFTSEIRSQYVNYGHIPRAESLRAPTTLRLEGSLDLEPEYRNAYCSERDYRGSIVQDQQSQQQQQQLSRRRRDRSPSITRRRDSSNNWLDNDNREHFGTINAADEQDAFQVLHTRVHEESVVGKPPPGSRRNSRSSLARASLQPDMSLTIDRSTQQQLQPQQYLRNRSPSPSYRLQVTHADDEPRSFVTRRRRSPSQNLLVHASTDRSPSPIQQTAERPYSPSFARENSAITRQKQQQQAFVVLDNRENNGEMEDPPRRRRTDRNYDPRDSLTGMRVSNGGVMTRPRNRTPPNWMPPWYDSSTSTI